MAVHLDSGILCSNKKKWVINDQKQKQTNKQKKKHTQQSEVHIAKWEKPIGKGYILLESNYVKFWKRQKYRNRKKISRGHGWEIDEEAGDRGYLGQWKYSLIPKW